MVLWGLCNQVFIKTTRNSTSQRQHNLDEGKTIFLQLIHWFFLLCSLLLAVALWLANIWSTDTFPHFLVISEWEREVHLAQISGLSKKSSFSLFALEQINGSACGSLPLLLSSATWSLLPQCRDRSRNWVGHFSTFLKLQFPKGGGEGGGQRLHNCYIFCWKSCSFCYNHFHWCYSDWTRVKTGATSSEVSCISKFSNICYSNLHLL